MALSIQTEQSKQMNDIKNTTTSNTKCGFISVIGKPNAGKSSLLNHITSQNMLIVSKKANATRRQKQYYYYKR